MPLSKDAAIRLGVSLNSTFVLHMLELEIFVISFFGFCLLKNTSRVGESDRLWEH